MKKLLLGIFLISLFYVWNSVLNVWNTEIKEWKYVIEKWDTVSDLNLRLKLNVNTYLYKIYIKFLAPESKLLAWTFSINSNITFNEFLKNKSSKPDTLDREVMILPWWNIYDIDELLANKWVINKWELIAISSNIPESFKSKYPFLKNVDSIEWFIYPETYRIQLDAKLEDFLKITLDTFNERIYQKFNKKNFYDNMIMASIVEKEERVTRNKRLVAWILLKRVNEWIAIWADATVCYWYKITTEECTPGFIWEHIYIKSKYNTRNKLGLPPTPISNFSDDSFDATVNSEKSDYYYYLHDMNWNIHFWKTLSEHNANKNKYIN